MRPLLPILATGIVAGLAQAADPAPSAATFQLDPRLEIRLWAAEPDVVDPVALAFDERGRAFVAECRDYPYGVGPDRKVGSTVRLLEDRDGDGRADRSTVFARDLSYATSVTPWRDGVLVTAAPDLLHLRDTDGDGVADVRTVLVTGFQRGVSDSLVNGLRFGPDSRIHGANGGNGGRLRSSGADGSPLDLADCDFSLDPDSGELRLTGATGGGFGLVFDDWGRAFTTYNIDHIQHRYLDRDDYHGRVGPGVLDPTTSISDHGDMAAIFPVSPAQTRPNHPEQSGHFSAAGGMGHLGSSAWPADLQGAVFVCDVVGNLVHREVIREKGAELVASRAPGETDREFLASRDPEFRPVALEMGADGALYLLDMQRAVIEHPDYIPAKLREKLDLRAGQDRGRIWRITPKGVSHPTRVTARLDSTEALVGLLSHGDQWWRATAQRLLVERRATNAAPTLRRALATATTPALGRLHAFWTLHGLRQLEVNDVRAALRDPEPGIRAAALRLCRPGHPAHAALADQLRAATTDSSPRVQFEAALALRGHAGPDTASRLAALLRIPDPWIRRAVLVAVESPDKPALLTSLLQPAVDIARAEHLTIAARDLADSLAADAAVPPATWESALGPLSPDTAPALVQAVLEGLASGASRRDTPPRWLDPVTAQFTRVAAFADDRTLAMVWKLRSAGGAFEPDATRLAAARALVEDRGREVARRVLAMNLLQFDPDAVPRLLGLLDLQEPAPVQEAALRTLRARNDPGLGRELLTRWRTLSPALRPAVLNLLLERRAWHDALLTALESKRVTVGELNLDLEQRRRLLRGSTREIASRASRFFGDEEYSNRRTVVDEWLAKLPPQGDPGRGRKVFQESCAQCHRCADLGQRVGPDLSGVAHRSVEDLLGNILDPNMALNPGFVAYTAETRDGESHTGLLVQVGSDPVVLVQAAGQQVVLPRRDLLKLESTGQSLMPEGLEAGRTPADLRDLIAFLQSAR